MSYATQADLESRYGTQEVQRSADRDRSGTSDPDVIATVVLQGLTSAAEEIDSYLAVRYDLPLSSTPARLVDICCDIGIYRLSFDAGTLTEEKRTRYEDAVEWLEKLAKSEVTLGTSEAAGVSNDLPELSSTSEERIFTRTKMGGLL